METEIRYLADDLTSYISVKYAHTIKYSNVLDGKAEAVNLLSKVFASIADGRFDNQIADGETNPIKTDFDPKTVLDIISKPDVICVLGTDSVGMLMYLAHRCNYQNLNDDCRKAIDKIVTKFDVAKSGVAKSGVAKSSVAKFVCDIIINTMKNQDIITDTDFDYYLGLLVQCKSFIEVGMHSTILLPIVQLVPTDVATKRIDKMHSAGFSFEDCCIKCCFQSHNAEKTIQLVKYFETAYGKDILALVKPSDDLFGVIYDHYHACNDNGSIRKLRKFLGTKSYYMDLEQANRIFKTYTGEELSISNPDRQRSELETADSCARNSKKMSIIAQDRIINVCNFIQSCYSDRSFAIMEGKLKA